MMLIPGNSTVHEEEKISNHIKLSYNVYSVHFFDFNIVIIPIYIHRIMRPFVVGYDVQSIMRTIKLYIDYLTIANGSFKDKN